ncbi:MAG: ExbD/TolR family protein [Phycisphaeraceae bacterium]
MKQEPDPTDPVSPAIVVEPVHPSRTQRRSHKARVLRKPELKLTSMIDVVFLLLIFFVVTASFTIDEGTLQANMPGHTTGHYSITPPVQIELTSADDGITYSLSVDGEPMDGASELAEAMTRRVETGRMASDDIVQIMPQGHVRWQHVLNVYNACVTAELEQVTFAY